VLSLTWRYGLTGTIHLHVTMLLILL